VRVAGPFTVESLSPHRSATFELTHEQPATADADSYLKTILDNLVKAGVQNGWRDQRLEFASLAPYPGRFLHAEGVRRNGEEGTPLRIAVSVGPQYGTVDGDWIKSTAREALRGVGFDLLLVCAFSFDAHASTVAGEFKPDGGDFAAVAEQPQLGRLPILLVRMLPGAGLVALVDYAAAGGWVDRVLARHGARTLVWAAAGGRPASQAMATVALPGVRAVVLAPCADNGPVVRLGLRWAVRLAAVRAGGRGPRRCVTSAVPPVPPPGVVRIPHLLTVPADTCPVEAVVWELMPADQAPAWLSGPLPAQPQRRWFETRLGRLLGLRAAARAGGLPPTAAGDRLAGLLAGRELSIRLVYRRPLLLRALLIHTGHQAADRLTNRTGRPGAPSW
jgi:hypothetical protein